MKSLLNTNLRQFLVYAFIIALCCAPLLFYVTKHFYTNDLDELTIYRSEEFKKIHLPSFTISNIDTWNYFNEDLQILEMDHSYPLNKPIEKNLYNKAEGHNIDYRIYHTLIEIEKTPYIFMSRIPMIENKDLILGLIGQYGILIIILLVSLSLMQQFISRKRWAPFYSTLQQIKSFNLEKGNIPIFEKTDIKEFSQLNEILEELIKDNLKTYTQQREFIENASHELQTPLSIFQSQLDILLQQPELTEKQVEIMQSLYSVSSRMTRLNKNLLLLAKIDNNHYKEMQEVDLSKVLNTQLYYLSYLAEDKGIDLEVKITSPLLIMANHFLLESLINNLIINAITHNKEKGSLQITIGDKKLIVSNSGENKPLNPTKIFQRFNQTSEKNKKGNGLGLSIIYQIGKFHGWKISYDYSKDKHIFTICF